jgi:hypothetical protein
LVITKHPIWVSAWYPPVNKRIVKKNVMKIKPADISSMIIDNPRILKTENNVVNKSPNP